MIYYLLVIFFIVLEGVVTQKLLKYLRKRLELNVDEIKFKRNAEFLIEDEVDIKYIKKIIFRSEADKKHAISILGENGLFEVNHSKFPNNYAYLSDYCIVKGNGTYYIELKFYLNGLAVERYTHELQITYSDKIKEKIDILYSTERIKRDRIYSNRLSMKFTPLSNKTVEKITYLMDGHISAVWERGKERLFIQRELFLI